MRDRSFCFIPNFHEARKILCFVFYNLLAKFFLIFFVRLTLGSIMQPRRAICEIDVSLLREQIWVDAIAASSQTLGPSLF